MEYQLLDVDAFLFVNKSLYIRGFYDALGGERLTMGVKSHGSNLSTKFIILKIQIVHDS